MQPCHPCSRQCLLHNLESSVHEPGHLKDVNQVQDIWVVMFHTLCVPVDNVYVHVFQSGAFAVKHPRNHSSFPLPFVPLKPVHEDLFPSVKVIATHVILHMEDDQLCSLFIAPMAEKCTFVQKIPVQSRIIQVFHSIAFSPLESFCYSCHCLVQLGAWLVIHMHPESFYISVIILQPLYISRVKGGDPLFFEFVQSALT